MRLPRAWRRERTLLQFERALLDAVAGQLAPEAGALLREQVEFVNKVVRVLGTEANCFHFEAGKKVEYPAEICFPYARVEERLATAALRADSGRLNVEIWLVAGRFFSLNYSKALRTAFAGVNLDQARPEIERVVIEIDPLQPRD
jgi:hypothetical protein